MIRMRGLVLRRYILVSLIVVTPVGFGSKLYSGRLDCWVNNYFGGMLYVIFWCLIAALFWPRASGCRIAIGVFIGTALLEFTQLWHPQFLEAIRSTFLGRTFIGTTFSGWDFFYYLIGCCTFLLLIEMLRRFSLARNKN